MEFHTNMTNVEKIAFLDDVVANIHKNIYTFCSTSGIDMDSLDLQTFDASEFIASIPENLPQSDWMARHAIARDMQKLIVVNKKLEELKND